MSEPIVFVIRFKIKEGKVDEFRKHYQDSIQPTLDAKPGTLIQLAYENEEATEFTVIRHFSNANALAHYKEPQSDQKRHLHMSNPIILRSLAHPTRRLWRKWRN